mmetsp:Transcript_18525/g.60333  ORF Transcript_18525/g.60333 Transcript_18525/m.60333 type:complete len:299 (+) Transcript_18525:149-1045(+)
MSASDRRSHERCSPAAQLLSSDLPMPSRTTSQSFGSSPAPASTKALSSAEQRLRSRSVAPCPDGSARRRPAASASRRGASSAAADARNSTSSMWVTSLRAGVELAVSATLVPAKISSRANKTIPITSAPALSQKITARLYGCVRMRFRNASALSYRHPPLGLSQRERTVAYVASTRSALSTFGSSSMPHSSSSQYATFATAAAAPASKRLPARAHSIANKSVVADTFSSPSLRCASSSAHSAGSISNATAFSSRFNARNGSASPHRRRRASFSSTMRRSVGGAGCSSSGRRKPSRSST